MILGKAKAEPFRVCANCFFLPSRMRSLRRFAWKVSKFDTELTSYHISWAAVKTSKS